jgi:hypothetical protein
VNDIAVKTGVRTHRKLPTAPCSVVWSKGRAYVLEGSAGRLRWVGLDTFGRPCALSATALDEQGWSRRRA